MKKTFKFINILLIIVSIFVYLYITFFVDIDLGSGHKELENIMLLGIPCFMVFLYSSFFECKKNKYQFLIYLICYITIMFGFVFSNNRSNILVNSGVMEREFNLVPFISISNLLNSTLGIKFALYNIVGNFLMLTPLSILLPMINNKFKNNYLFVLTIITLCIFIETTQYLTGLGSFDIDDIILNTSGAIIIYLLFKCTKLNKFIEYIFTQLKISKYLFVCIYAILLILFVILLANRIISIKNYLYNNRIDYTNFKCISEEKTYLGNIGNYEYYSLCNYGNSYIKVGNQNYTIYYFLLSPKFNKSLINKLKLETKEIITNVLLEEKNSNNKKLLYSDDYSNIFLYGFNKMKIEKNDILYDVEEELNKKNLDIAFVHTLVEIDTIKRNNGYSIETGKYYNILTCGEQYSVYSDFYVLDLTYNITENSCKYLQSIEMNTEEY